MNMEFPIFYIIYLLALALLAFSVTILETIIKYSKNVRLVLMSATPMYDSPKEIIFLLNLMLLNDNREKINEHKIFNADGELTNDGRDILIDKSRGYVSYFRGGDIKDFPYRIYPPESITPSFKYNIKGDPTRLSQIIINLLS